MFAQINDSDYVLIVIKMWYLYYKRPTIAVQKSRIMLDGEEKKNFTESNMMERCQWVHYLNLNRPALNHGKIWFAACVAKMLTAAAEGLERQEAMGISK